MYNAGKQHIYRYCRSNLITINLLTGLYTYLNSSTHVNSRYDNCSYSNDKTYTKHIFMTHRAIPMIDFHGVEYNYMHV